jgi:CBS domain-containing protein
VTQTTERTVASRVPKLADEPLITLAGREPLCVRPGTLLRECIAAVQSAGSADSVFVTDESGHLLGVLPERDVFARLTAPGADLDRPVDELMIDHPWTLRTDRPIRHAMELMQTGRYRNVPLVDGAGLLVGAVRPLDILKYLAEAFPEALLNLPPRPNQPIMAREGG